MNTPASISPSTKTAFTDGLATLKEWRAIPGFNLALPVYAGIILVMMLSLLFTNQLPINVYNTYAVAAKNLMNHVYPYPVEPVEFHIGYKYSPLYGVLFYPIQLFSSEVGRLIWIFINFTTFLAGLGVFLSHCYKSRQNNLAALLDKPYKLVILLLLIFNEMSVSIKIGQANSLVCGLMLMGLAHYAQGKNLSAGILLALASNFKIFPLALALLLLWDFRAAYWKSFLRSYIVMLFLPALVLGWEWNFDMLVAWHKTLLLDFETESKLSLMKFLEINFGFSLSGIYRGFVVLNIILLCIGYRYSFSAGANHGNRILFPLTALFILLFNHRSEIELFVMVTPVYAMMYLNILEMKSAGRDAKAETLFLVLGYFLITHLRTDLVPSKVGEFLFHDRSQSLGSLILYLYYAYQAWKNRSLRQSGASS